MKTIADIKLSAHGMVDVQFDDNTALSVDRDVVKRFGLKIAQAIDDSTLDKLLAESDGSRCYDTALHFLEFRSRSEYELRRHLLIKHKFSSAAVEKTIERLRTSRLLDDRAFAEAWVNDRITYKPKSRLMIQKELMLKGISPETIADAVGEVDDTDSAYQAGLKKARLLRNESHLEFYKRLSSYLGRRGYGSEVVRLIVHRLWQEIHAK